jgi:hypothetical protein
MKQSQGSHATGDAGGEKERKGMQETIEQVQATLKVIVTYPAAKKPFEQDHASRNETVGTLKTTVLSAFGLSEGQSTDGKTFVYTLYHGKTPLENLSETLGQIAGDKHTLELKLSQQVTQG